MCAVNNNNTVEVVDPTETYKSKCSSDNDINLLIITNDIWHLEVDNLVAVWCIDVLCAD